MNQNSPFTLFKKTVLVTGASSGIGKSIAIEASKTGATLIIIGRNIERLNSTFSQLHGEGHIKIIADLNIEDDRKIIIDLIPKIDGIVHSAGIIKTIPFKFLNIHNMNEIFNTNFFTPIILTQQIISNNKLNSNGSIVFISSIEGNIIGHSGNSIYSASKGALSSIIKSMALELSYKNIRVNCILPGLVETELLKITTIDDNRFEIEKQKYPLRRFGKPEDIAFASIYFLSDASSWVTGTNFIIDGGFTIQ